jgi:hypothetical protein
MFSGTTHPASEQGGHVQHSNDPTKSAKLLFSLAAVKCMLLDLQWGHLVGGTCTEDVCRQYAVPSGGAPEHPASA